LIRFSLWKQRWILITGAIGGITPMKIIIIVTVTVVNVIIMVIGVSVFMKVVGNI
jgi:hypothetical protein